MLKILFCFGFCEIAQWVETLTAKHDGLNLILGIHMVEGKNWLPETTLWAPYTFKINKCEKGNTLKKM